MREIRSYGSVRGVPGNRHSYRNYRPQKIRTLDVINTPILHAQAYHPVCQCRVARIWTRPGCQGMVELLRTPATDACVYPAS
jgi:hypothetical protein